VTVRVGGRTGQEQQRVPPGARGEPRPAAAPSEGWVLRCWDLRGVTSGWVGWNRGPWLVCLSLRFTGLQRRVATLRGAHNWILCCFSGDRSEPCRKRFCVWEEGEEGDRKVGRGHQSDLKSSLFHWCHQPQGSLAFPSCCRSLLCSLEKPEDAASAPCKG